MSDAAAADTPPAAGLPAPWFESSDKRFRLYQGDCLDLMPRMPAATFDLIFADPPYFLSNGGITCHAGRMVSVNKGKWDQSRGVEADHEFNLRWLGECQRLLKPDGSLWVSGTMHIIHSVGYAMQRLGMKVLNDITWVKPNPPPNLSCRYFTHATETVLWAGRDRKCRHKFNYALMKRVNGGKQMKSVWEIETPRREEKVFGKHPTQKSLALLERIIAASSDENDLVLDPFSGSGTKGIAAARLRRAYLGLDRDESFLGIAALRFLGVPQADSPDRILAVVQSCAESPVPSLVLAQRLGVTERQVQYCRQAAVLLGLMAQGPEGWRLTEAGRLSSAASAPEARRRLACAILETPLVRLAAARVARQRDERRRLHAVACMLRACTVLGQSTCLRRAQTLLTWIRWARDMQDGFQESLFRDVPPAAEESDDAPVA